ncbi:DUF2251 domain-containing protein [Enterovibrio makurazakiensis]|uniref:DUF2251 domain-containing protein n=1 Tax=Enterovibrio makurazakiensis TaxID=2910232 RepID=UPI003D1C26F1
MSQLVVSGFKHEKIYPGTPCNFRSESPIGRYEVVFEDDGNSGYFYPLDNEKENNPIITAFGIYQCNEPSEDHMKVSILWGEDATKVALLVDGVAQAYFDFSLYKGTCKSEFCPVKKDIEFYGWNEQFMENFLAQI